jgi:putative membrane protein
VPLRRSSGGFRFEQVIPASACSDLFQPTVSSRGAAHASPIDRHDCRNLHANQRDHRASCGQAHDAQIAHIAYTAGQIDIEVAKQALSKSTNQAVRAFAEEMVRDHTAVNKQALDLVHKLKVTPEANDLSRALTVQMAEKRAELANLKGAEFDEAYLANEVAYHLTVNGALEVTLIPAATHPELKRLLQSGLKIFQGHQQHAQEVVSALKWPLRCFRRGPR